MSSFPTCQVCHQQFSLKGPAPFLLPCLHAVCETCVTAADGGVISCSTCQRDVNLTETPLQKDAVREQEILHLTLQHHPELVLCTNEDDGNQALCWCRDCDDFLCEHCQMSHERLKSTRHHDIQDIGEIKPGCSDEDEYCSTHPRHILDAWDKDCCRLTCGKCRLGDHAGHTVVDFDEVVLTAREEVAALGKQFKSKVNERRSHPTATRQDEREAATEQDGHSSEEACNILSEKITHTFNDMKVLLNQREKELQIELQQYKGKLREELNEKKRFDQRCQTTSDYINKTLKYSSRHDIMSLKPILKRNTEECISWVQASDKIPLLPRFNADGLEKIRSALSSFGTIASMDDPADVKEIKDSGTQTEDVATRECVDLKKELVQLKKEHQTLRDSLTREKMEEQYVIYRLKENVADIAFLLHCTNVEFSQSKYNAQWVHISAGGELINKPQPNPPHSEHRLKKYRGTSSTVPLPQCGSPQYFEVESHVCVEETLTGKLLLEIGLAREEEHDQSHCVASLPQSYSLVVAHCTTHSSICRMVWRHDKRLMCLPDTLENTPGTTATLRYGVDYDVAKKRLVFLDIKNMKILCRVRNINSSVTLWPMFGVHNPSYATVRMSLVVGSDIDMTVSKKALILKGLA